MPGNQSKAVLESNDIQSLRILLKEINSRLDSIDNSIKNSTVRITEVEGKVEVVEAKLVVVEGELAAIKANYEALLSKIDFLEAENKDRVSENLVSKCLSNDILQRGRMFTVRFLNVKEEILDADEAAKMLYDRFIAPTFIKDGAAVCPAWDSVIEYCHLLPANPKAKKKYEGHCYILRFCTRFFKLRFFLQKKSVMKDYNDLNKGNVKVQHDYTFVNRECLSRLHDRPEVKRVTVRGSRLMFKLDEEGPWKLVRNPYAKFVADMTTLPAEINGCVLKFRMR